MPAEVSGGVLQSDPLIRLCIKHLGRDFLNGLGVAFCSPLLKEIHGHQRGNLFSDRQGDKLIQGNAFFPAVFLRRSWSQSSRRMLEVLIGDLPVSGHIINNEAQEKGIVYLLITGAKDRSHMPFPSLPGPDL